MKKIIICICAVIVFIYSLGQALASGYNFEILSHSEKNKIDSIGTTLTIAIDQRGGCGSQLYQRVYNKIIAADKNYYDSPKKRALFSYLRYLLDQNFSACWEVSNEDNEFLNILTEVEQVSQKRGTFRKHVGSIIEARQNNMYTYFYYNDILINTIKNKINSDKYSVFGKMWEYPNENDYLSPKYAKHKLNLYSAHYLDNNETIIYFSKKTDNGSKNYIYNSMNNTWTKGLGIYSVKQSDSGTQGVYILGENGRLLLYRNNGNLEYIRGRSNSSISNFRLGYNGSITLFYNHDSEEIYVSE